jgi:hypothetical protein
MYVGICGYVLIAVCQHDQRQLLVPHDQPTMCVPHPLSLNFIVLLCFHNTQGIKWVVNREEPLGLVVIQQSQHKYIDKVVYCIENGLPMLIENLPVDIDAVLDAVIGKQTIKKGKSIIMKIGDAEVCAPSDKVNVKNDQIVYKASKSSSIRLGTQRCVCQVRILCLGWVRSNGPITCAHLDHVSRAVR